MAKSMIPRDSTPETAIVISAICSQEAISMENEHLSNRRCQRGVERAAGQGWARVRAIKQTPTSGSGKMTAPNLRQTMSCPAQEGGGLSAWTRHDLSFVALNY